MTTITIAGLTTPVRFIAATSDIVNYMGNLKTDLLSNTLSIACHILRDSNISAFKDMDMFFATNLDSTIRRFIPMTFNKVENKWELNKERADKVRDELALVRGQFDFAQLCEAIDLAVAKAENEAKAKEDAQAEIDAALMAEQGLTVEALQAQKDIDALVKYIGNKVKKMDKAKAFSAINSAFPEFGAMYMQMRNSVGETAE